MAPHPFFLTRKLEGRQSFEVEIVALGTCHIMIGIASDALRNTANCYNHADALTLYLNPTSTYIYYEGK